MEAVRRIHNNAKRSHITKYVRPGMKVLDVGCGRGGDILKWKERNISLTMGDPDRESLEEAKRRARGQRMQVRSFYGDIMKAPKEGFDCICFNFSLQYIFCNFNFMINSLVEITKRANRGCILLGCIPDSNFILSHTEYRDSLGNIMRRNPAMTGFGNVGEKIEVMLADTPYYDGKFIPEPIAYRDVLMTWLENNGWFMQEWSPLLDTRQGTISDMYSKFCFVRI